MFFHFVNNPFITCESLVYNTPAPIQPVLISTREFIECDTYFVDLFFTSCLLRLLSC